MRAVSIINLKGGVAKTTTTVNMAYLLAKKGYKVRFRGLITLGVWKSAKNIQKLLKLASLRQ